MKYLICSDIHGSETACKKIVDYFTQLNCNKLIILGDILYHGPRNPLPQGHNPKGVIELLNPLAEKIIACRGNCDAEVDQMVLNFPIMSDFSEVQEDKVSIFCTHGHIYAPTLANGNIPEGCNPNAKSPQIKSFHLPSIIFYGHTHVSVLEKNSNGSIVCNPGSPSLPKGETPAGFAVLDITSTSRRISLFDLNGNAFKTLPC